MEYINNIVKEQGITDIIYKYAHQLNYKKVMDEFKERYSYNYLSQESDIFELRHSFLRDNKTGNNKLHCLSHDVIIDSECYYDRYTSEYLFLQITKHIKNDMMVISIIDKPLTPVIIHKTYHKSNSG